MTTTLDVLIEWAHTLTPDSSPAEVRKAWAERLRNPGDIVQGYDSLAPDTRSRCCLGVLCDLAVQAGVITDYDPDDGAPNAAVRAWADLGCQADTAVTRAFRDGAIELPTSAIDLNDTYGFTFADIADLIDDGLVLDRKGEVFEG